MSDTHLPGDQLVNAAVRYERTDASFASVFAFIAGLFVICAASAALLWWLFIAYIEHENQNKRSELPWTADQRNSGLIEERQSRPGPLVPGTDASGLDPRPRLETKNMPGVEIGQAAREQRQIEEAYLQGTGWVDREKGIVHIPIGQAMDKVAEHLPAKAGTSTEGMSPAPSRSNSGREPVGGKP
jgi:hypothetical protein